MQVGDVVAFLRTMEAGIIRALADEGVEAEVREGLTGVWVGDRKIGSIGLHVSRGVTIARIRCECRRGPAAVRVDRAVRIEGVRMTSLYLAPA